jgi:hypothetical protein
MIEDLNPACSGPELVRRRKTRHLRAQVLLIFLATERSEVPEPLLA